MAQSSRAGQGSSNSEFSESREGLRVVLYLVAAIVVILVLGFVAGLLDNALRGTSKTNAFIDNSREILLVLASTAPWIAFFIILCSSWVFIADRLFVRWNRILGGPDEQNKGVIYEIVHDNNSAAALVLFIPMIIIAMGLIYVALLNLPYNIPTVVTPR